MLDIKEGAGDKKNGWLTFQTELVRIQRNLNSKLDLVAK
jgi:hypothetical protein